MNRTIIYINFSALSVYAAYLIIQASLRAGFDMNSQISIVILLAVVGAMAWVGKWVSSLAERIGDEDIRDGVTLSTFIWAGLGAGLLFAPSGKLSATPAIPFIAILAAVYRPLFFKARGYTPFLAGMSALAQVASLAYILRIGGDYHAAFGVAFIIWLAAASVTLRYSAREDDGGWGAALSYGQAIPVFWFFLNISNQTISYSGRASSFFLGLAIAGFMIAAWRGRGAAAAERPGGWIIWAPAMLFGLSLLVNFNIAFAMDRPLDGWWEYEKYHGWFHIYPGLDFMYNALKPFVHYAPVEGTIWGVYIPRILFEYLDSSAGGYLLFLHLSGRVTFLLFLAATCLALRDGLGIRAEQGFLVGAALAATNIIPMQIYAVMGYYVWVTLERMQMLFVAFLAFRWFHNRAVALRESQAAHDGPLLALGFLTGVTHTLSILYEMTFGAPGLLALAAAVFRWPFTPRAVASVLAGGVLSGILYTALFHIPAVNFFYHHPAALLTIGKTAVIRPEYKYQIFDAWTRGTALQTLEHTSMAASFVLLMALIPFLRPSRRDLSMGLYLIVVTLMIYISRGQKFLNYSLGPYTNLVHINMVSGLAPAMLAYVLGFLGGGAGEESGRARRLRFAFMASAIAVCFVNGIYIIGGLPGWKPAQVSERGLPVPSVLGARGLDEAFEHMYSSLSRSSVKSWPQPHSDFTKPYSQMRDYVFNMMDTLYIDIKPPYDPVWNVRPLVDCPACLKGPAMKDPAGSEVRGGARVFTWEDTGPHPYYFYIRSAKDPDETLFKAITNEPHVTAANLPAGGETVLLDLRAWGDSGVPMRTLRELVSLPGVDRRIKAPVPARAVDPGGPVLKSGPAYIVTGASLPIEWSAVGAERYEISVSAQPEQKRGTVNLFVESTEQTSTAITGLPGDCSHLYIHLEAYINTPPKGEWRRNSYQIFSAPEGFMDNPGLCPAAD